MQQDNSTLFPVISISLILSFGYAKLKQLETNLHAGASDAEGNRAVAGLGHSAYTWMSESDQKTGF